MDSNELEDVIAHAGQVAKVVRTAFEEVTGEDLDLETALKHYPVIALGVAASAGLVGGWWLARRSDRRLVVPEQPSLLDSALESLREAALRLSRSGESIDAEPHDGLVPSKMNALRRTLPELLTEERVEEVRLWIESVVEPRLESEIDRAITNLSKGKVGTFVRSQLRTWGLESETTLDDPEDSSSAPTPD